MVDAVGKQLVDACVAGDAAAREQFRQQFFPIIYHFERRKPECESANRNFISFLFDGDRIYRRLYEILTVQDVSSLVGGLSLKNLTAEDRRAILEIVRETKPGLPSYWAASGAK